MAALEPRKLVRFHYLLTQEEEYSAFQAEALKAMRWEGLLLPEPLQKEKPCRTLVAEESGLMALTTWLETQELDTIQLESFLEALFNHLWALWHAVEQTHLLGDNLCLEPESLLLPIETTPESLRPELIKIFYLPVWRATRLSSTGIQEVCAAEESHAQGSAESGRLGLLELYLKTERGSHLTEARKTALIHAASRGMESWEQVWHKRAESLPTEEKRPVKASKESNRIGGVFSTAAADSYGGEVHPLLPPELLGKAERMERDSTRGYPSLVSADRRNRQAEKGDGGLKGFRMEKLADPGLLSAVFATQALFYITWIFLRSRYSFFQTTGSLLTMSAIGLVLILCDSLLLYHLISYRRKVKEKALRGRDLSPYEKKLSGSFRPIQQSPLEKSRKDYYTRYSEAEPKGKEMPALFSAPGDGRGAGRNTGRPALRAYISQCVPGSPDEEKSDRTYLMHTPFVIGTDPLTSDFLLPGKPGRGVAATIEEENGLYQLTAGESCRITINGKVLSPHKRCTLPERSTLRIGEKVYYFISSESRFSGGASSSVCQIGSTAR